MQQLGDDADSKLIAILPNGVQGMTMIVTKDDICLGLRKLGIKAGDSLLVHSSLSSFGHVEGGADAVIDAILEAISPGGNAVFPTMTGNAQDSAANPPHFDVLETHCWTGAIPETARRRPYFIRSAHPTHSVCVCGSKAAWIADGHEYAAAPWGTGSSYEKVVELDGYLLFLGVNHNSNTTLHYVETLAQLPYPLQKEPALSTIKYADGRVARVPAVLSAWGTPRNFSGLEPEMIASGIQVSGSIGPCFVRLLKAREMVDYVLGRLREDPSVLLGGDS
jgi:aminoglycoside 3-N-acetyltransferase